MKLDNEGRILAFEIDDAVSFIVPKDEREAGFGKMANLGGSSVDMLNTALGLRSDGLTAEYNQLNVWLNAWDQKTYKLPVKEVIERTERKISERKSVLK